jgi:Leucine-rich repeat (LRR) protein
LEHIGKLPNLRWLRLDHTRISDEGVRHLTALKNLTDLSLSHTDVSDECLVPIAALTQLESLGLRQSNITAAGVKRIRQALPKCEIAVTFGLGETPVDIELFPDTKAPTAEQFKARFKELGMDGHVWTDASQPGNPITQMFLGESTLSDQCLLNLLAKLPMLRELTIRSGLVGDEFVRGIQNGERLKYLEFSQTRLTDAGVSAFSKLTGLYELVLNNNRISDKAVPHLSKLTNLKLLHLEDTRISEDGIRKLKQALPGCSIY